MNLDLSRLVKTYLLVILVVLVLISGIIAAVIINSRLTTERQNQLAQQQQAEKDKQQKETAAQKHSDNLLRGFCIDAANSAYSDYVKLNATSTKKDASGNVVYQMPQTYWDAADKTKQEAINNCYKQYPVN